MLSSNPSDEPPLLQRMSGMVFLTILWAFRLSAR